MGTSLNGLVMTHAAQQAIAKAKEFNLRITSTTRTPAESVSVGGYATDDHTKGLALDVAGSKANMDKFAKWAKASGLFRWVGWQVAGHYNHVHVSWLKGPTVSNGSSAKYHTVQAGESLWSIAKKYGIDFNQIKEMNSELENKDLIFVGQKIKLSFF
jgi:nucleoid-associated protein YgaU